VSPEERSSHFENEVDMTTIKKVLCAIDLTEVSRDAFDRALSIARASRARLYVLHAVPANYPFARRQSERLELLTSLRERAEREGVAVRTVEQHGDPARTIVLHANARKADLVVLGSNRRRGWRRFREGSVGERVLRQAAWPLLIVPRTVRRDDAKPSTGQSSSRSAGAPRARMRRDRI
jgi:nucleotide-binding universal stress UspA family protein